MICNEIHNFRECKLGGGGGVYPFSIIFEREHLPQQTIYRWTGNLTVSTIHLKYWKIF